jgi:hypothetical protein
MRTEMGEYVVGAYLKVVLGCDHVGYNVRPPGGGLKGLGELDVIGMHFKSATAYLCEVATHLDGLNYGRGNGDSNARIAAKVLRQQEYARENLAQFPNQVFMFWSPVVRGSVLIDELRKIEGLKLFINEEYTEAVGQMRALARTRTSDSGNPFFRALQILEHLRGPSSSAPRVSPPAAQPTPSPQP